MTPESVIEFGQHALYIAMLVAAPLLLTALAVGLLIGTVGATFFVAQTGEPESGLPYRTASVRGGRSWSSR